MDVKKMKLFEYAVIHHPAPTEDEQKRGAQPKSELLVEPEYVLAFDEKEASVLAARAIPDSHVDQLDRVEIVLRPF